MVNPKQQITVNGEGVEILITPSMYRAELVQGLDLTVHNTEDAGEVWALYARHLYLAYLNARAMAQYEGRPVPEKALTLSDIEAWSYTEGKERFTQFIQDFLMLKTGKSLAELMKKDEAESKKKAPRRRLFRWWRRGSHAATSS